MKAKLNRPKDVLIIPGDNFIVLKDILDDGTFVYEVKYFIDQVKVIKNDLTTVEINVFPSEPIVSSNTFGSDTKAIKSASSTNRNILNASSRRKDATRKMRGKKRRGYRVDTSRAIDKSSAKKVKGARTLADAKAEIKTRKKVRLRTADSKASNVTGDRSRRRRPSRRRGRSTVDNVSKGAPITQTQNNENLIVPTKDVSTDGFRLLTQGTDPSEGATRITAFNSAEDNLAGTIRLSTPRSVKIARRKTLGRLLSNQKQKTHTDEVSIGTKVPVIVEESENVKRLVKEVIVSRNDLVDYSSFFLEFNLLDSFGFAANKVVRRVDHSALVRNFNTPRIPPEAKVASQNPGRITLAITQKDKRATKVQIFKKSVNSVGANTSYGFITEIDAKIRDGDVTFIDDNANTARVNVYRVIPIGRNGEVSTEFTNVVAKASSVRDQKLEIKPQNAAVVATSTDRGVRVNVRGTPKGVVGVFVQRRDCTIREGKFTNLGNQVTPMSVGSNTATITDGSVKKGHVYEYRARLIYRNGGEIRDSVGSAVVEFVPKTVGVIETFVSPVAVQNSAAGIDAKFTITSKIQPTQLDKVKSLLTQQGYTDLFIDDIKNERDKLQDLIAYSVKRINMGTGETEDFGVITGKVFSDRVNRTVNSIKPLKKGSYKYIVSALLRSAESMLRDFEKTTTDDRGNTYSFKPSKYHHPLALNSGNLTSEVSVRTNYAKDEFAFNEVGSIVEVDVVIPGDVTKITNLKVEQLDDDTNLVEWRIVGNSADIDYFIITGECLGTKFVVGKAHPNGDSSTIRYLDTRDTGAGSKRYFVTPVYKNYSHGETIAAKKRIE